MAQTTKKKKTNTKGKSPAKSESRANTAVAEPSGSFRREGAAICFVFAAMFVVIGIFAHDGFVVGWICSLLKGLFGYGFWVCAPVFILVADPASGGRLRPCCCRSWSARLWMFCCRI